MSPISKPIPNLVIRLERLSDHRAVEELTREAFWTTGQPGCDEHLLVHKLRQVPAFVPELDYVAELRGKIIGNIMFSKAKIVDGAGTEHEVLTFGPISVLPEHQGKGVGRALLLHTIAKAKRLGYRAIVFFGHPDYYPRFGFRRAAEFNLLTSAGKTVDAFMAMPLVEGSFDGISGRFYEDPVFEVDKEEATRFDKGFAHKEPGVFTPMEALFDRLEPEAQETIKERGLKHLRDLQRFSGREVASWPGIDDKAKATINATLKEHGLPTKPFAAETPDEVTRTP